MSDCAQLGRVQAAATAETGGGSTWHGTPATQLPMLDPASVVLGGYIDVVAGLQTKLRQAAKNLGHGASMNALVVGHGGRDSLGMLAVVEAVRDPELCGRVQVHVCTCSWPDDQWEEMLEQYLHHIEETGVIEKGAVHVHSMKFHSEHPSVCATLRNHLEHKDVVVQCEQGVDFFVEPLSNQFLQDNYEDNFVHHMCMTSAQEAGIPVFLLQTNTDLDLSRGIQTDDINGNIFDGDLQTNAFGAKISFQDASQVEQFPESVIDLAVRIGDSSNKRQAFKDYLHFDPSGARGQHIRETLYADFIIFCAAKSNARLPFAGVMEVIASLQRQEHKMPWKSQRAELVTPPPQWMLGRLLQPTEVIGGRLRVLAEFREAGLHEAKSLVDYLCLWMRGRRGRRGHGAGADTAGRFAINFRAQLLLARQVLLDFQECCPDIDILANDCAVLRDGLAAANVALPLSKASSAHCAENDRIAKRRELGFEYVPIALFMQAQHLMILDFTCCLLESNQGVDAEFKAIWESLPPRGEDMTNASDLKTLKPLTHTLAEVFTKCLINACRLSAAASK